MSLAPLILVVGPSGAGKDSLIAGARAKLTGGGRFHFARRVVTRPAEPFEDHDAVSLARFHQMWDEGGFLLSWAAHGLAYGIPLGLADHRNAGIAVVANVSRTVIERARNELAPVGVIVVTAPAEILAARLHARGRESADDIRHRLARAAAPALTGQGIVTVDNGGDLEGGVDRFVAALLAFHPPA